MKKIIGIITITLSFSSLAYSKYLKPIMISDVKISGQHCAKIIITNLIKDSKNKAVTINRLESSLTSPELSQSEGDILRNKIYFSNQYEIPVDYKSSSNNEFLFKMSKIYLPSKSSDKIHDIRTINLGKMSCDNIYFITMLNAGSQSDLSLRVVVNKVAFNSQDELKYLYNEIQKSHKKLQGKTLVSILIDNYFLVSKSVLTLKVEPHDLNKLVPHSEKLREVLSMHINRINELKK